MFNVPLKEVLNNAILMETEDYLNYCDTIESIFKQYDDKYNICVLQNFYYPQWFRIQDKKLLGFQEPGAYIETYNIFAVNRKTNMGWSLYYGVYPKIKDIEPIIPEDKLMPIMRVCQEVFPKRNYKFYESDSEYYISD